MAAPCEEIARDPSTAALYTARQNIVAVITNGTVGRCWLQPVESACFQLKKEMLSWFQLLLSYNKLRRYSTAVLGLGDIGPLASKPVMEGKVGRCTWNQ